MTGRRQDFTPAPMAAMPDFSAVAQHAAPEVADESFFDPSQIFAVIRRQLILTVVIVLVVMGLAGAWLTTLKPYYESSAQVMVGARQMVSATQSDAYAGQAIDLVTINSQVGVLKSPVIAESVVRRLNLVNRPEYRGVGQPGGLGKLMIRLGLKKAGAPLSERDRFTLTAATLMGQVAIANDGRSTLIAIGARASTADLAMAIANGYVDAYLQFERQAKIDAARHASELLEEQIAPLRLRAVQAEQAVSSYREAQGLDALSDTGASGDGKTSQPIAATPTDERLTQMNRELGDAEADLVRKQAVLDQATAAAASGDAGAVSSVTGSALIQNLSLEQSAVNARIATLSATALDQNPELIAARSQSARIGARIAEESHKILGSLRYDVNAARGRVEALKGETGQLQSRVTNESHANIRLRQLLSEASAAQTVYRDYLSRLSAISAETTLQQAEVRVITPAETPLAPAGPPRKQYGILAVIVALAVGVGAAMLRDRGRRSIETLAELERSTHLFGIGILPYFRGGIREQIDSGAYLYGRMLDAIRSILAFGRMSYRARVVVVTSACPEEGKTTLAVSLAAIVGKRGERALVVDCDPHKPGVLALLGMKDRGEGLIRDVLPGMDVLIPQRLGHGPTLHMNALADFIEAHRLDYDQIVLDTPPVLAFPEAGVVSSLADGVILAVRWERTKAQSVTEAHRRLGAYDARCIGAVLTCVQVENLKREEGGLAHVHARYQALPGNSR